MIQISGDIIENYKEKILKQTECLIPTPGDCWNTIRLKDHNCVDCKYFEGCTHENKGKMVVKKKSNKKK